MGKGTAALLCVILALPAAGEERYLIPSYVDVEGANGSVFVSDLTLLNVGSDDVIVRGLPSLCPVPTCTIEYDRLAKRGITYQFFEKSGRPGLIVKAPSGSDLRMNLRVRTPSRAAFSAGTELPVVRESAMRGGKIFLLDVPQAGLVSRNRLRVYSFDPGQVRVTVIQQSGNVVLADYRLDLQYPADVPAPAAEFYPAFAESVDIPVALSYLRIEIEPIDRSQKVWAFTTTTNNVSHEITVVSPQP